MHVANDEYLLTAAEPNLAYFAGLTGRPRRRRRGRLRRVGRPGRPGSQVARPPRLPLPDVAGLGLFDLVGTKIDRVPVTISRTGFTGDLGFEVWVPAGRRADGLRRHLGRQPRPGIIPIGLTALYMARIEAGLLLLDVDFHSSRFAWTDADRSTPIELGLGWMFRDLEPPTTGRSSATRPSAARSPTKSSRWRLTGLIVDWQDYDRIFDAAGLIPPKDHTPVQDEYYIYDDELNQLGYATSQMYSPMLQRHIALARVPARPPGTGLAGQARDGRSAIATSTSTRTSHACPSSTPSGGPPDAQVDRPTIDQRATPKASKPPHRKLPTTPTTPSSSVAATTA